MAFIHEIKFFKQEGVLFSALFEYPPDFCREYWIKNVPALELGIERLPENVLLEQKYKVEALGIKPFYFYATVPIVEFIDAGAKTAWETGGLLGTAAFLP
jgi:hypothetical protein